ncbi:MAG: hypothetical protein SGPRY_004809 [Prymnesium sp.]
MLIRTGRAFGTCCALCSRPDPAHTAECSHRSLASRPELPSRANLTEWLPDNRGRDGKASLLALGPHVGTCALYVNRRAGSVIFDSLVACYRAGALGCGLNARLVLRDGGEFALLTVFLEDYRVQGEVNAIARQLAALRVSPDGSRLTIQPWKVSGEEGRKKRGAPVIWSFTICEGAVLDFIRVEPSLDGLCSSPFWTEFGGPNIPAGSSITTAAKHSSKQEPASLRAKRATMQVVACDESVKEVEALPEDVVPQPRGGTPELSTHRSLRSMS